MQDRFNMIAIMSPSAESGTSWPAKGIWKNTVLGSHFDTFHMFLCVRSSSYIYERKNERTGN